MVAKQAIVLLATLTSGSDSFATGIIPVMLPSLFLLQQLLWMLSHLQVYLYLDLDLDTGLPVSGSGLDRLIAASSMLQPSALTRNDQPFVGQAGPQFQQNLFHRLLVSTSICAIHCLQNCSLKSLSHSFSSTIIWFGHCRQKKCVPKLRTLQAGRSYSSNPFPATLEWFIAIPASHPLHTPACYRLSMDGLR